jgi:sensor histidine kinase regulating citrate/malate metabolism
MGLSGMNNPIMPVVVLPLGKCANVLVLTSTSFIILDIYLVTELNRMSELEAQLVQAKTARDLSDQNLRVLRCHRHDFLNHLQVILGYIQLGKVQTAEEYIKGINEELKGIRVISGLSIPEVSVLLLFMRQKAVQSNIRLDCDIKADLTEISVNPQDLVRILSNLIDNAIYELKDSNRKEKLISVSISNEGKKLHIEVYNTGSYISGRINIFSYGYTTKGDKGSGLGLYVVKDLVENKYKGKIELVSDRDYGTRFSIAI